MSASCCGSSPRARGTAVLGGGAADDARFIPAGAGNRYAPARSAPGSLVHPRGRGEQVATYCVFDALPGSSPRARGTDQHVAARRAQIRFIPAGAGNRPTLCSRGMLPPVHPRGRGEQCGQVVGGKDTLGSSPRARGTGHSSSQSRDCKRFIPAGAGNRPVTPEACDTITVHPRGRGEQFLLSSSISRRPGSSPRARGTADQLAGRHRNRRFIPAGAGNSAGLPLLLPDVAVHPRGRGEQDGRTATAVDPAGSSPRARGTVDECP